MRKHQTDQTWKTFYRITCPWNLQKCQGQERQRKAQELFQIKGDESDMTIKNIVSFWIGSWTGKK